MNKIRIPVALREQVWIHFNGRKFENKCYIRWCKNKINVFDFQVGHNIPESKGGPTTLENLRPVCSRCNQSMSNNYSIDQWNELGKENSCFGIFLKCFAICGRSDSIP
jgi:5-methylcytosine-specific restriction endonuclease McrA